MQYSNYLKHPIDIKNEGRNIDIEIHRQYRGKLLIEIMDMMFINKWLFDSFNALDLGTSAGSFTQVIANYFKSSTTGIDADKEMIEKAKLSYPHIEFKASRIEDYETQIKFDFIMCLEVIEHCDDDNAVVKKIFSLLRDGGIALISMPNNLNPIYSSARILGILGFVKLRDDIKLHFKYNYRSIEKLFERHGFEIVYRTGFNIFIHRILAKNKFLCELNWLISKLPLMRSFTQYYNIIVKKPK